MDGGVSQVDSFDPKPRLAKENGQNPYDKFKVDATQFGNVGKILKSPWDFKQYGESGIWMSDLFPNIATCVDDIAVIRSMVSNFPEHTNANYFLHTGSGIQGRPSMGAWVNYGLGSMNDNLPGYVVLDGGLTPPGGLDNFKNGFLPATYQASVLKPRRIPVSNIVALEESSQLQIDKLKHIEKMDQALLGKVIQSDQISSTIDNYELAFNMQSSLPELTDLAGESEVTKELYGLNSDDKHTKIYGTQCILARRLVERGVRFIELTCPNVGFDRWDQHSRLKKGHEANAHAVDQPIAGLLKDLKSRGLLEETLVVFAGEFGRTPFAQGKDGRDHNPSAFSIWLAGAGIKGGTTYGTTDEYGYRVVDKPTTIHDLHATMLHLLGVDHVQQTYRFGGRDIRLTDVHGHIIKGILA
ncbi:sulfatase [Portibacter lacus]|uniref:Sulfatase n=2 Tax=Portibacter lacus TaxID=1099794 RepID=A0AA37SSG6_9BACT|nr:sulfatase [Portibacter lacus]